MIVRKPFILACYDTSLGAGYLSGDWVPTLNREIRAFPEAVGPVEVHCLGHGGWTSSDLLAGAGQLVALQPTHILTEGGAINDCVDFGSGPAVSRATHIANNQTMINLWRAGIAGVDITVQTMNSVSDNQTARTTLGAYYADEIATAQALGVRVQDNYAGWPKPLASALTHRGIPFVLRPPTGFSDQGTAAALWSTTDKEAGVTVSADGLTATGNGGSIRGTTPITGKVHFEIAIVAPSGGYPAVGIANSAFPLASGAYIGQDTNSIGWNPNDHIAYANNTIAQPGFANAEGTVIGMDVDTVAKTITFRQGALSSAALDISGISGAIYPAMTTSFNSGGIGNFSQSPDGLHPLWSGAVDTYLYPNVKAWVRARMAEFWA